MDPQPDRSHLYLSVAILNLVYLIVGTTFVWSSPVLVKLPLTDTEGSTVASMLSLGSVLGPFVSGAVLDSLGRKYTVGLAMALEMASYLTIAVGRGVTVLSVGRFIGGVSCGIVFSAVPMFVAEISEDSVRGLLNTLSQMSICSGSLLMYVVGPYTSYAVLHYIMLGLCVVFFLLFPLLPRSPYELVMNNQIGQAEKTLMWLRNNRPQSFVMKELQLIQNTVQENEAESSSVKELFTSKGNRRALIICCTLLVLQQISGVTIVFFYSEKIFRMTGSSLSSTACSIIVGAVMASSAVICPVAVKKFGYKKPLLASAAGMALGMGCLAMFFILKVNHFEVDSIGWLPLFSIVVYILFFNTGFANIPWALSGELFPGNIKPIATTLVASICGLVAFITTKLFPDLIVLMGIEFLFMACSFFCGITVLFVTLVVQDTSGLSFVEIQEILNGCKRKHLRTTQMVVPRDNTTHV